MKQFDIKLQSLPSAPGVYQFKDKGAKVIYVGKAKNLRLRVRSYFQKKITETLNAKTRVLISKIRDVEIIMTTSEVEALILENNLIKKFKPRYNINLRDDKSYPYIVITNEHYPRVMPTRNINQKSGAMYFGPYTDGKQLSYALDAIYEIFQVRKCTLNLNKKNIQEKKFRVCLDYYIKKCQGPCEGLQAEDDYNLMIEEIKKILKGKAKDSLNSIEKRMKLLSSKQEYEDAAILKNQWIALKRFTDRQKVVSVEEVDRDVFAVSVEGDDGCGVVFKVRNGVMVGSEHYYFSGVSDESMLEITAKFLENYYADPKDIFPNEIFLQVELKKESKETILSLINEQQKKSKTLGRVSIIVPRIGEKAKLVQMCLQNANHLLKEFLVQKQKRGEILSVPKSVHSLKRDLRLRKLPLRIECFDNSNLQGSDPVSSMVCFVNGKPKKSEYRKFKIKTVEGIDDFASMSEVIERRYTGSLAKTMLLPDLIVVDGGKGQLSSALRVLKKHKINVPVIGIAKRLEEVFIPNKSLSFNLPKTSSSLKLLQQIRDESHRTAVAFHRERRTKRTIRTSLSEIKGIGKKRAMLLLKEFGSVDGLKKATDDEIAQAVGKKAAFAISSFFKSQTNEL